MATEALVFMVNSYTVPFKAAVAYFLVDKLNAEAQAQMLKVVIERLHEVGVTIRSLTCDGAPANLSTYHHLGCSLPQEPWFPHPTAGSRVMVFMDPPHMIKLARNALDDLGTFDSPEGEIKWKFFVRLIELQDETGLKLANKLSARHIFYKNKIMNVSLAVQLFSSSVTDALQFCVKSGVEGFEGCEATILYARHMDRLFDAMNSRSPQGTGHL